MIDDKTLTICFSAPFRSTWEKSGATKVAILASNEYEGFSKNGGIGTYYTTLSKKLKEAGWSVILLLCQSEQKFQGKSDVPALDWIFSTGEVEDVLTLQPVHLSILAEVKSDYYYTYQSICCLFFIQALCQAFPDAQVYVEFPDVNGFGYHTIQAKQAGLLPDNCLTAITIHGCFEWVFQANDSLIKDSWFLLNAYREQQSFEKANLAFFPSHFLKSTVESYGWRTFQAKYMPYFVPIIANAMNELATVAKTSSEETAVNLPSIPKKIHVVFFGRLEERKGLCTFVKAIQLLDPELKNKLQIAFLGKVVPLYSAELKHLNSQQYIEQELGTQVAYEIISNLYSTQAIEYVKELDSPIVCLTSPQENFPNSALEMGQLPVSLVVSDTGGFRETLQLVNRESGVYWFKPKDADSLAQMLKKALLAYPETPIVCNRATLEQVNNSLLAQKLEYIERAFNQAIVSESTPPKVTLALTSYNQGKYLIECLSRIEAQTYENLEVIVLDDGSTEEYSQEIFEQAQSLFPKYQFIKEETSLGLGYARNRLLDLATGDYFLPLEPQIFLFPFALEKFATAASHSRAAIITCPRKEIGEVERIVNFSGGTLPTILKANVYDQSCVLFSRNLLKKFRHTESKDSQSQAWEIIAAAVATGEKIVYYPYPLYEYKVTAETVISHEPHPREQYSIRQYLAQIPPADWSPRQIYMLLTAIQQLQNQPQQCSPAEIEALRSQILSLESKLLQARKEAKKVKKLKAKLVAVESSKFWKFRQKWFRLKQFFRLPTDE